jgi:hypothetical protein
VEYNEKIDKAKKQTINNRQLDFKGDETSNMIGGFQDSGMSDIG